MKNVVLTVSLFSVATLLAAVYNPCGVVVDEDAWFKIGLRPADFPDSKIRWFVSGTGSVSFPDGSSGREFRVRGISPGDITLSVQIGDATSDRPCFFARVVTNSIVRASAWILSDDQGAATTVQRVESLVAGANEIWKQAGLTFSLVDTVITNMPGYLDVRRNSSDGVTHAQVVDLRHGTGALELYFVRSMPNGVVAANSSGGLVAGPEATASTLAHELGHACGLRDIYPSRNGQTLPITVSKEFLPRDWNSETRSNYWPTNITMRALLPRLLMYGYKEPTKCDITIGDVMGVWYTSQRAPTGNAWIRNWRTSLAPIGFFVHGTNCPVHQ